MELVNQQPFKMVRKGVAPIKCDSKNWCVEKRIGSYCDGDEIVRVIIQVNHGRRNLFDVQCFSTCALNETVVWIGQGTWYSKFQDAVR